MKKNSITKESLIAEANMEQIAKIKWEGRHAVYKWDDPDHWGEEELLYDNGRIVLKGWQDAIFLDEPQEWEYEPDKDELIHWLMNNDLRNLYFVKGRKRAKAKASKMMPNWMLYMNDFYIATEMPRRLMMQDYFKA